MFQLHQLKNWLTPFFALLFLINLSAQSDVLTEADQMPYFYGCNEANASEEEKRNCSNRNLIRFISNELTYPATAKDEGIEGTVYVGFVINEQGEVVTPKVIRDIGGGCGEAALNVIKSMPIWEPGLHQGHPVKIKLNVPIHFSFKNEAVVDKGQQYQINWGSLSTQVKISKQDLEKQMSRTLHVRDPYGDEKSVTELIFTYEKKRVYSEASSAGKITNDLKKIIAKAKKGGTFSITAVVQVKGELIFVKRAFQII